MICLTVILTLTSKIICAIPPIPIFTRLACELCAALVQPVLEIDRYGERWDAAVAFESKVNVNYTVSVN